MLHWRRIRSDIFCPCERGVWLMQLYVTCCTGEICSCSNSFRCYKSSLRRDRWANTKRCMCSLPAPIIQFKLAISFTHSPPCTHTHTRIPTTPTLTNTSSEHSSLMLPGCVYLIMPIDIGDHLSPVSLSPLLEWAVFISKATWAQWAEISNRRHQRNFHYFIVISVGACYFFCR